MELNTTKKDIINHLIAAHEGRLWGSKLSKYIRAFTGAFSPDMPFTFYFLSEMHPIMYVYDPKLPDKRTSREIFHAECNQKKPKILEITNFYDYLVHHDYLDMEYKGIQGRPKLPDKYYNVWRKYSDFYSNIMSGLSFVCLSDFTPTQKLYDIWKTEIRKNTQQVKVITYRSRLATE